MLVIFLDGESKSGKTAVGRSIRDALAVQGHTVRLLVAGNFFRQLTLQVLSHLPAGVQPNSPEFKPIVEKALASEDLLRPPEDMSLLESDAVEGMVSQIAQHAFVQDAASSWRLASAQRALDDGVDILLFDGRNLRSKLGDWAAQAGAEVALELIIYCRPEVAAARYLSDEHTDPTPEQLQKVTDMIEARRAADRTRAQAAYTESADPVPLVVGTHSVDAALIEAWAEDVQDPPRPIRFDNSEVPRDDGLRTVTELAVKAIDRFSK